MFMNYVLKIIKKLKESGKWRQSWVSYRKERRSDHRFTVIRVEVGFSMC